MKNSILLIISLFGLICSEALGTDIITAIASPTSEGKTGEKVTIKFTIVPTKILKDDVIILSKAAEKDDVVDSDPRMTIETAPLAAADSVTGDYYFMVPAEHQVYIKRGSDVVLQSSDPFTVGGPTSNLISKIDATEKKAGKAISYTFTIADGKLKKDNKITLSNSTTVVASTDTSFTLEADATGTSLVKELTIANAGTYYAFVTQGTTGTTKQAASIAVTSSGFISITFAVLLGLFLF